MTRIMPEESSEILIVEDSRTQAEFLRYRLESHGYQARVAASGQQALTMLEAWQPELIISDINMPGMNGYDFCRAVKQDGIIEPVPVILLTSLGDPQDILRGLECGADSFISKPYDEAYLLARMGQLIENWRCRPRKHGGDPEENGEVLYEGQVYRINASRQQMLDLLLSIYETAMLRNIELLRTRDELTRAHEELAQIAIRDDLTGLYNRRELNRFLREEVERNRRYGRPLSLMMIDIDNFKAVNDTYGHQVGDEVLRVIARLVIKSMRTLDRPARYGGEEFAIVLPETQDAQALAAAEHLRQKIAAQPISVLGQDAQPISVPITVSIGVAAMPQDTHSEDALISAADKALYRAKNEGRNRVVAFNEALSIRSINHNGTQHPA